MLRKAHSLTGIQLHGRDGELGHVEDFLIDEDDGQLQYFLVDTKNWLPGRQVLGGINRHPCAVTSAAIASLSSVLFSVA